MFIQTGNFMANHPIYKNFKTEDGVYRRFNYERPSLNKREDEWGYIRNSSGYKRYNSRGQQRTSYQYNNNRETTTKNLGSILKQDQIITPSVNQEMSKRVTITANDQEITVNLQRSLVLLLSVLGVNNLAISLQNVIIPLRNYPRWRKRAF